MLTLGCRWMHNAQEAQPREEVRGWEAISLILGSCPNVWPSPSPADSTGMSATSFFSLPTITVFSEKETEALAMLSGLVLDSVIYSLSCHWCEGSISWGWCWGAKWSREKCSFSWVGERIYSILLEVNCFWI